MQFYRQNYRTTLNSNWNNFLRFLLKDGATGLAWRLGPGFETRRNFSTRNSNRKFKQNRIGLQGRTFARVQGAIQKQQRSWLQNLRDKIWTNFSYFNNFWREAFRMSSCYELSVWTESWVDTYILQIRLLFCVAFYHTIVWRSVWKEWHQFYNYW